MLRTVSVSGAVWHDWSNPSMQPCSAAAWGFGASTYTDVCSVSMSRCGFKGQGEICNYGTTDEDLEEEVDQRPPLGQMEHEAGIHGYSLSVLVVGLAKE